MDQQIHRERRARISSPAARRTRGLLLALLLGLAGSFEGAQADGNCPQLGPTDQTDSDGDGVGNVCDNCAAVANPSQRDTDNDAFGNLCDPDLDNDGVVNFADLGLMKAVFFSADPDADLNGDGAVNFADLGIMKSLFFGPPGPTGVVPRIFPPLAGTTTPDGSLTVTGFSFPDEPVELVVDGQVVASTAAGPAGAFDVTVQLEPGTHDVAVEATDPATSTLMASQAFTLAGPTGRDFPLLTAAQEPVRDDADADAVASYPAGGSVILNSGEKRLDRVDLAIPGRGQIGFVLQRRYRSRILYDGPLGFGWDFTYNERLSVRGNGDVVRANGRGHVDVWRRNADGSFSPPPGYFGTLTAEPDGTYILRGTDGFRRVYSAAGALLHYQDRFGNAMQFDYDPAGNLVVVTDAFGREHDLEYQTIAGRDRITLLRDFAGREVVYSYDANGDLVTVRSPLVTGTSTGNDFPAGRTEMYSYASAQAAPALDHNLLTITYPEEVAGSGPPAVTCVYGTAGADLDRVTSMVLGGTNASGIPAGGTISFAYTALNQAQPPGDPTLPRLEVALTERNGNQRVYQINEHEHLIALRELTRGLRSGEPPFYETTFFHDADGQQTARMLPEGNRIEYLYDHSGPRAAQRNVIQIRRIADAARGGGEDLVTTRAYEPVFNQLASSTDPRGNALAYDPPLGVASAARYTTRHFYDYQENDAPVPDAVKYGIDLSAVARGLGDLNGDGLTDQLAGNPIRSEAPPVLLRAGSNEALRLGSTIQPIVTERQWNDRGQPIGAIDAEGNLTVYDYYPENDPDGDGVPIPGQISTVPRGYLRASIRDAAPAAVRRTALAPPAELESVRGYDPVGNVVTRRNPRGVVTTFEVNQLNEVVVTTRGADVSHAEATGQLITAESAFGFFARRHFDFNGRVVMTETENRALVSTTDGVGPAVERTFSYDILDNQLTSTVEIDAAMTAVSQRRYDGNELLTQLVKPEGNVVQVDYDERNLRFRVHDGFGSPEAAVIQYDYDLNGNLARVIDAEDNDADGNPESALHAYDGFDRRTVITDPLGNQSVSTYDVASNLTRQQRFGHRANQPLAGNVLLADVRFHYDELNRVYRTDQSLFLADGFDPLRPEDLRDHDSDGLVTTLNEYDALSRPTFSIEDDTNTTRRIYDGASRMTETIDALGNRIVRAFDRNDNIVETSTIEISPEGLVPDETFTTRHVYDQLDRLVRTTDNAGRTQRFGYDSRDNPTTRSDAVGPLIGTDPLGLFPGSINGPGNTVARHYDGRDLMVKEVRDLRVGAAGDGALDLTNPFNPDGQVTVEYAYDLNSRLITVVDDNGNTTSRGYDALDRQVLKVNADTTTHVYGYDRDSNQISIVDPNGNQITNTFDGLNRLVQRGVVRAVGVVGTTQESYSYDGLSRLTASADNNGGASTTHTVDRIYDSLTRLLEEQEDFEPHSSIWSGDGNRLQLLYPTSRLLEYEYDALDRVKRVIEPFPNPLAAAGAGRSSARERGAATSVTLVDYGWMGPCCCECPCESRPLLLAYGNGTELSYLDAGGTADVGYNDVKEVVALTHNAAGSPFIDRAYSYNRAYMRTGEHLLDVGGAPENDFTFDSTYRTVTTSLGADDSPEAFSTEIDYSYDGVGNRRTVDFTQTFGGVPLMFTDDYLANVMNEYDDAGGGPREHDPNGNLTRANGFDYAYDYRNRLVEVRRQVDRALLARYEYDTFNRRVKKTVFDLANPGIVVEERRYRYDGLHVIEEWGDDDDYNDNGPVATYVYGARVDEPVQMETSASAPAGAGKFHFHQDARTNVVAMTDAAGVVVERTRYDDFGNFTQDISIGNPYLFQGRRYDPETGLFYYRNRYYDPQTGRFLQRDPVWDPRNMGNQYSFGGNNPTTSVDPLGLKSWWDTFVDAVGGALGLDTSPPKYRNSGPCTSGNWMSSPKGGEKAPAADIMVELEVFGSLFGITVVGGVVVGTVLVGGPLIGTGYAMGELAMILGVYGTLTYEDPGTGGWKPMPDQTRVRRQLTLEESQQLFIGGMMVLGGGGTPPTIVAGRPCPATVRLGPGLADEPANRTYRFGGYDPETNTLFGQGAGGHSGGYAGQSGRAPTERTPGVTIVETPRGVYFLDDSMSLGRALTPEQQSAIQQGLESAFPGRPVAYGPAPAPE